MTNKKHMQGQLGVYLVLLELFKMGIDALPTPDFWPFDIFTKHGIMLEVKFSNIRKARGGSGYYSEAFTFRISPIEKNFFDFLILVLNTHKGFLFCIIPENAVKTSMIAFNPFSRQKSQYEKYLNRWDLVKKAHDLRRNKEKFKEYLEKHHSYFNALDKFKAEERRKIQISRQNGCYF